MRTASAFAHGHLIYMLRLLANRQEMPFRIEEKTGSELWTGILLATRVSTLSLSSSKLHFS